MAFLGYWACEVNKIFNGSIPLAFGVCLAFNNSNRAVPVRRVGSYARCWAGNSTRSRDGGSNRFPVDIFASTVEVASNSNFRRGGGRQ